MKKTYLFFLSIFLVLLLAACGDSSEEPGAKAGEETSNEEKTNYPEKPIKITVGFPAGGATDMAARTIAEKMSENIPNNVDIAVENKPGGGGVVGVTNVVNAKPDGYNIGFTPDGPLTVQTLNGNATYAFDDTRLISQTVTTDVIIAVHPDSPWETFDEMVEAVSEEPGKYSYGTPGAGSLPDIAMQQMEELTGMEMKSVPFEGNAPARTALMGKDVDVIALAETDILPYAESGELKPLINLGEREFEEFPDLPRAQDEGYDINSFAAFLFYGPKDLPDNVVKILDEAIRTSMEDPEVIEAYEKVGLNLNYRGPDDATKVMDEQYANLEEFLGTPEE